MRGDRQVARPLTGAKVDRRGLLLAGLGLLAGCARPPAPPPPPPPAPVVLPPPPSIPLPPRRVDRIVVRKAAHELTLYRDWQPLKTYKVALGTGGLAPKRRAGDHRTPEGVYRIDGRIRDSEFHRALRISYPSPRDVAAARARGADPGGGIMIHGIRNGLGWLGELHLRDDWTNGCIAVTNEEIEEIWDAVADGTVIEILP